MERFVSAYESMLCEHPDMKKFLARDKTATERVVRLKKRLREIELFKKNTYKHEPKYYLKCEGKRVNKNTIQGELRKKIQQMNEQSENRLYFLRFDVCTVTKPENKHEYYTVTPIVSEFVKTDALSVLEETGYEKLRLSCTMEEKLLTKTLVFLKNQLKARKIDRRCEENPNDNHIIACLEKNSAVWVKELYSFRGNSVVNQILFERGFRGETVDVKKSVEKGKLKHLSQEDLELVVVAYIKGHLSHDTVFMMS